MRCLRQPASAEVKRDFMDSIGVNEAEPLGLLLAFHVHRSSCDRAWTFSPTSVTKLYTEA